MTAALAYIVGGAVLALAGLAGAGPTALAFVFALVILRLLIPRVFVDTFDELTLSVFLYSGIAALAGTLLAAQYGSGEAGSANYLAPIVGLIVFVSVCVQLIGLGKKGNVVRTLSTVVSLSVIGAAGTLWVPLSRASFLRLPLLAGLALIISGLVISRYEADFSNWRSKVRAGLELLLAPLVALLVARFVLDSVNLLLAFSTGVVVALCSLTSLLLVRTRDFSGGLDASSALVAVVLAVFLSAGPVFAVASIVVG